MPRGSTRHHKLAARGYGGVAMNTMLFAVALVAAPPAGGKYLVLVDPGPGDAYLPAARRLAEFHKGEVIRFDPAKLDEAFATLKERRPDFVAFVLPPDKIDVDL